MQELDHEEPERFFIRCSSFFIVNMEHVCNWVAAWTSDYDQVKTAVKDKYII